MLSGHNGQSKICGKRAEIDYRLIEQAQEFMSAKTRFRKCIMERVIVSWYDIEIIVKE